MLSAPAKLGQAKLGQAKLGQAKHLFHSSLFGVNYVRLIRGWKL